MLTVRQAAAQMGISVRLLYDMVASKAIAHCRIGGKGKRGKVLFHPDDLADYLAASRVAPQVEKAVPVRRPKPPKPAGGFRHLNL